MLRLLLSLAAISLLAVPSLSLTTQPATSSFHSWNVRDIAPYHDASSPNASISLVYALDLDNSVYTLDGQSGRILRRGSPLGGGVGSWSSIAANGALKRIYALGRTILNPSTSEVNYTLAILTSEFKPIATIPLSSALALAKDAQIISKPMLDSKGNVFIVRRAGGQLTHCKSAVLHRMASLSLPGSNRSGILLRLQIGE